MRDNQPITTPEVDAAWQFLLVNWIFVGFMGAVLALSLVVSRFSLELTGLAVAVGYVGLYAGLSYAYILSMIFPLYNAIESLDKNQIEAARDLGAPWWHIHLFVVMPYAKPGIAAGCTLVFMLCAGALAAPQILGGPSSLWFTQVVYNWFFQAFDWTRGSAYAFALLVSCIIFVLVMLRLFKVSLAEIAR